MTYFVLGATQNYNSVNQHVQAIELVGMGVNYGGGQGEEFPIIWSEGTLMQIVHQTFVMLQNFQYQLACSNSSKAYQPHYANRLFIIFQKYTSSTSPNPTIGGKF